jgi:hypothetical protein
MLACPIFRGMNQLSKIAFFWVVIGMCYVLHGYYELTAIRYGAPLLSPAATDAAGVIPVNLHIMRIVLEIGSLLIGTLTVLSFSRPFQWFSFVWAILLGLLNGAHLAMTVARSYTDYTQLALLTFIFFVNVLLALELRVGKRESV